MLHKINYYGKEISFYLPNSNYDHIQKIIKKTSMFYEIDMLQDLLKIVPSTGIAIDVGANIGNHSLFFAGICNLKTYSFEPFKSSRKILEKNISINNLANKVTVINGALGNKNCDAHISSKNVHNSGTAQIEHGTLKKNTTVRQLDEYALTDVALLKIDVEGMELDVLRGALKTITNSLPIILIEAQTIKDYNAIKAFLEPLAYTPINKYNDTPTILFLPNDSIDNAIPFLLSKNHFHNSHSTFKKLLSRILNFI